MIYVAITTTSDNKYVDKFICNDLGTIWAHTDYLNNKFKDEGKESESMVYKWYWYEFYRINKFFTRRKWYDFRAREIEDD